MTRIEDVLAAAMQCGECESTGQAVVGYDTDMTPRFGPCTRCARVAAAVREHLLSDEVVERAAAELERAEHAPMADHDPRTGECVSCPWPLYMVSTTAEMARAALTAATEGETR